MRNPNQQWHPHPHSHSHRVARGLTLIELMIAIAVGAVLVALAAPSFTQALGKSRLSSAASELTSAVQLARTEAIRNNRRVTLCRSEDGSACSSASSAWPGWIVFVDTDSDGVRDSNEPVVKSGTFNSPLQVLSSAALTAAGERITFRGDGTARASNGQSLLTGTLAVCIALADPADNVRDVSLAFGSRTAVHKRNAGGACATPGDTL
jgi:type IV fimbrial biogenesis protein FimT